MSFLGTEINFVLVNKEAGTKLKDAIFLEEKNDVFLLSGKLISVPGTLSAGPARASSSLRSCGVSSHGLFPQESPLHSNQFSKNIKLLLMIKANSYKKSTYVLAPFSLFSRKE
ncbi:hypothetical protein [Lysinibacillus telephonicus]|uniref:hypothetical protein n=1 Tax=Lysinibacillus telephonicus TaxID=1714840 RepID=UPI000F81D6E2|nr:hypothetical protein [Lysinibacillus telephonicus]